MLGIGVLRFVQQKGKRRARAYLADGARRRRRAVAKIAASQPVVAARRGRPRQPETEVNEGERSR
jgi:hypothetical protein